MIWFKNPDRIKRVRPEFLEKVIEDRTLYGHFLTKEGRKWVAVDNSTGEIYI